MEDVKLIKKETISEKTRNKTSYVLLEKGKNANKILLELSLYSLNELECSKLNEKTKNELLNEYETFLNI